MFSPRLCQVHNLKQLFLAFGKDVSKFNIILLKLVPKTKSKNEKR